METVKQLVEEIVRTAAPWMPAEAKRAADALRALLAEPAGKPRVVNAGLLKAGKSTLFNALCGDPTRFAVADVRCTAAADREDCGAFELVDTPGTDCDDLDTAHAGEAFRTADLILFVHNLREGDLAADEIALLRELATHFPDSAERSRRVVVVGTQAEKCADVPATMRIIGAQVAAHLGAPPERLFETACHRWEEGIRRGRPGLVEKSGVPAVRAFLDSRAGELAEGARQLLTARIRDALSQLDAVLRAREQEGRAALKLRVAEINQDAERARADVRRIFAS